MSKHVIALVVAGSMIAGNAWAGGACIKERDALALQTAVVQQELMVAALSCSAVPRYNQFVMMHQVELQKSDAVLLAYFRHVGRARGTADYHTFKTKAANNSALESARDPGTYCANATRAFDLALGGATLDLASFVRGQSDMTAEYVPAACEERNARLSPSAVAASPNAVSAPSVVEANTGAN